MDFVTPEFLPLDQATIRGIFEDKRGNAWCVVDVMDNWGYTPSAVILEDTGDSIRAKFSVIDTTPESIKSQRERPKDPKTSLIFGSAALKDLGAAPELCSYKENHGLVSFMLPRLVSNIQIFDS